MPTTYPQSVAILLATISLANAAPGIPTASPPQFGVVQSIGRNGGVIEVSYVVFKPVYETKTMNVETKGQIVTQTYVVAREVPEQRVMQCNLRNAKVLSAAGKELTREDAQSKLKAGMPVLISYEGKTPDAYYRQFINSEVLVLVMNRPNPANRTFPAPEGHGDVPNPNRIFQAPGGRVIPRPNGNFQPKGPQPVPIADPSA